MFHFAFRSSRVSWWAQINFTCTSPPAASKPVKNAVFAVAGNTAQQNLSVLSLLQDSGQLLPERVEHQGHHSAECERVLLAPPPTDLLPLPALSTCAPCLPSCLSTTGKMRPRRSSGSSSWAPSRTSSGRQTSRTSASLVKQNSFFVFFLNSWFLRQERKKLKDAQLESKK